MIARQRHRRPSVEGLEARSLLTTFTITGTVFQDSYQDGRFDQSGSAGADTALRGQQVYLDLTNEGHFDTGDPTAVTGSDGSFALAAPSAGTFHVRVVAVPGDFDTGPVGPDGTGVSVTLTASQPTASVIVPIFSGSAELPLSPSSQPFGTANPGAEQAQVGGLYTIMLGRQATSAELNAWMPTWSQSGGLSKIATAIIHSAEYDDRVVAADYQNFLGRPGQASEIAGWAGLMEQGGTAEQVAQGFLSSPGFSQIYSSNTAFVDALYEDVLGREPVGSEATGWVNELAGGTTTRAQAVVGFLESTEALQRAASGMYTAFLNRPADPGGLSAAVQAMANGLTQADLAVLLGSSAEYVADAQKTIRV